MHGSPSGPATPAETRRWPPSAGQLETMKMVAVGTTLWPVLFFSAYWGWWPDVRAPALIDRLLLALKLSALPAGLLWLMVLACARLFDNPGAEDPFARAESRRWQLNQRVLSNSMEQTAIFLPLLLALSTVVDERSAKLLPIFTSLFVLGRVLFWIGIHLRLSYRSVGFDLTYYTSLATLIAFARFALA